MGIRMDAPAIAQYKDTSGCKGCPADIAFTAAFLVRWYIKGIIAKATKTPGIMAVQRIKVRLKEMPYVFVKI